MRKQSTGVALGAGTTAATVSLAGAVHDSTEGAWVQTPSDALCTLPNLISPTLNTLHEFVLTHVFPTRIRPTYSVPSGPYFENG